MSTLLDPRHLWDMLRSPGFDAGHIIRATATEDLGPLEITHLRSAHYAVYKVAAARTDWVVRIGAIEEQLPVDNTGFMGTSTFVPSGQAREFELGKVLGATGAVISPLALTALPEEGLEVLWLPFIAGSAEPVSAARWGWALNQIHITRPAGELPVFTNRAKSFARLDALPDQDAADRLRSRYDEAMRKLFDRATRWSLVHGDAHAGNVVNLERRAVLYDLDTACWAPTVWDLTHLLNRAGTAGNTGYTAAGLLRQFDFSSAEVEAALALRRIAAEIATAGRAPALAAA